MDYPKSVPGVGLVGGKFTDGNALLAQPASLDPAAWANLVTDELINVVRAAGLTPSESQSDQLLQAIQKFASNDYKNSVRVVVTVDIALAGLQTVDGVTLTEGDRVLVAGQTTALQNGIYVAATGAWTRSVDADTSIEVTDGLLVPVEQGTSHADSVWQLVTNGPIVLGTTALTFEKTLGLTGITAGTYKSLTVDKRGRVVGGTNPTTLAGYGITDGFTTGEVTFFACSTPPNGYLKANGALLSRTTYADLFAAIGTTFGAGDGSTTFRLPDLRGEFIRGWDDGRLVDALRVFGANQGQDIQPHTHSVYSSGNNTSYGYQGTGSGPGVYVATSSAGSTETRPRNIALLACIKY